MDKDSWIIPSYNNINFIQKYGYDPNKIINTFGNNRLVFYDLNVIENTEIKKRFLDKYYKIHKHYKILNNFCREHNGAANLLRFFNLKL